MAPQVISTKTNNGETHTVTHVPMPKPNKPLMIELGDSNPVQVQIKSPQPPTLPQITSPKVHHYQDRRPSRTRRHSTEEEESEYSHIQGNNKLLADLFSLQKARK